jgi:hypothetical protein
MERNIERIAIALESLVKLMEAEDLRRRRRTLNEKKENKAAAKRSKDIESKTIKAILKKSKTKE